jgi:hypothetical protein
MFKIRAHAKHVELGCDAEAQRVGLSAREDMHMSVDQTWKQCAPATVD